MTTITLDSSVDFSQTLNKSKIAIRSNSYAYQLDMATGNFTQTQIGEKYQLAQNTISLIVNDKRWKEITV